jgi:hypothetical protein
MPKAVERARAIAHDAAKVDRRKLKAADQPVNPDPPKESEMAETTAPTCSYCHRATGHTPSCKWSGVTRCACGGAKRHKPGCAKYAGKGKKRPSAMSTHRLGPKRQAVTRGLRGQRIGGGSLNGASPGAVIRAKIAELEAKLAALRTALPLLED